MNRATPAASPDNSWREVTRADPCPICGRPDWCRSNSSGAVECHRVVDESVGDYRRVGTTGNARFAVYRRPGGDADDEPRPRPLRRAHRSPEDAAAALAVELGGVVATIYWWSPTFCRVRVALPDGGKTFRPLTKGRLGWTCRAPDRPHPLYRVAELPPNGPVYVVEGEKAADAGWSIGLPCTTSGGCTSAPDGDWGPLTGREAVVLPDNDDPGRQYARAVVEALRRLAPPATVRVIELPGLPPSGDLHDFVNDLRDGQDAEAVRAEIQSLCAAAPAEKDPFRRTGARELLSSHPRLRDPVVEGIAREGELVNVIAPPKTGKSWLALDLALAVGAGRPWLGHRTRAGRALLVDNELHPETLAHRIPQVADARSIRAEEYLDALDVQTVRGQDVDLLTLDKCFSGIARGMYRVVILDALYRFWPRGTDENDNAGITAAYNALDQWAERLRCVFILIHHASKGNQSGKAVADVGSGAGAIGRATDTHVVLRGHEQLGAVVLEAAVRSFPPLAPRCLRWAFPVWVDAPDLDPADLLPAGGRKKPKPEQSPERAPDPPWSPERFAGTFLAATPRSKACVVTLAEEAGLPARRAERLLTAALETGLAFPWADPADRRRVTFATIRQPGVTNAATLKATL